jgi:hypothetical protein
MSALDWSDPDEDESGSEIVVNCRTGVYMWACPSCITDFLQPPAEDARCFVCHATVEEADERDFKEFRKLTGK